MPSQPFTIVEEYAGFGVHRTGSATQAATADWLADHLSDRGGRVETVDLAFDRYVAEWSVSIAGREVESLPLFYEAVGSARTDDPVRWEAFAPGGSGPLGVTGDLHADLAPGGVVVAATAHYLGGLTVPNRLPAAGSGSHVLLVAGHHGGDLLDGAPVRATIDARVEPATCPNVVARFGEGDAPPIIVTTPISGWFACAGERGTGIAVALELVDRLREVTPVLFLGATGHELGGLGAAALRRRVGAGAGVVLHVGANVGCDWAPADGLAAPDHGFMAARFAGPDEPVAALRAAFAPTGHPVDTPGRDRDRWFGEAAEWLDAAVVLSLLGQNPWFHCPEDLPGISCTAARTEAIARAFTEAALVLVGD